MAEFGQPLQATGHSKKFTGEGGEDEKPQSMPSNDAHANKTYFGPAGKLKAGRPTILGGDANRIRKQGPAAVQRSRKRTK